MRHIQKVAAPLIRMLNAYLFFFFLVLNGFIEFGVHFHCKLSNRSERSNMYHILKNGLCIKSKTVHYFMAYNDFYINGMISIMWDMAFHTVL